MTSVVARARYESTIPYAIPASLDDLQGPAAGVVEVGAHIDTSPRQGIEEQGRKQNEVHQLFNASPETVGQPEVTPQHHTEGDQRKVRQQ